MGKGREGEGERGRQRGKGQGEGEGKGEGEERIQWHLYISQKETTPFTLFHPSAITKWAKCSFSLKNKNRRQRNKTYKLGWGGTHLLGPSFCYGNVLHKIKNKQLSKLQLLTHQNSFFPFSCPPTKEILATCLEEDKAMAKWDILHHAFPCSKLACGRLWKGIHFKGEGTFYIDCALPFIPLWGPTENLSSVDDIWGK